jgi:hypothetical protein
MFGLASPTFLTGFGGPPIASDAARRSRDFFGAEKSAFEMRSFAGVN